MRRPLRLRDAGGPMRFLLKFLIAVFSMTLAVTAHASKRVFPDSCGKDEVKFDVKLLKDAPAVGAPEADKAQIVFIEVGPKVTTRIGMDGKWLGATQGDSYFVQTVEPGEHHFCAQVPSSISAFQKAFGMTKFTAEAGKTYYLEFKIDVTMGGINSVGSKTVATTFLVVDEDEGKFRVKSVKLSQATAKKSSDSDSDK